MRFSSFYLFYILELVFIGDTQEGREKSVGFDLRNPQKCVQKSFEEVHSLLDEVILELALALLLRNGWNLLSTK